ncbi:MAG TPA: hypothetical protein VK094_00020 [Pseudogracilibacillus sp.]|nr:hypothetical protein [Pseudogracilibacillus sp.]
MKQFFRFFSLGLFVASLTIFIFYNYFDSPEVNPNDFETEELIDLVEEDGYRVITEEEYITYTVNEDEEDLNVDKNEDKQDKDDNAEDKDGNEEDNDDTVKYTLEIKPDMMPHEVILLLEEKKIIKDAEKFADFMDKNDYSPYIQQGEFELTSDMSEEEIAKTITKK